MGLPRRCIVCEELFEPVRRDARYCGAACRQLAWRRRQKQRGTKRGASVTVTVNEGGKVFVSSRQAAGPRTTPGPPVRAVSRLIRDVCQKCRRGPIGAERSAQSVPKRS